MATIALQANRINNMPGMIKAVTKSVVDYKSELSSLKRKSQTVNRSVCNLDDIVGYVQSSTQTQEEKINSLEAFSRNSEQFVKDTVRIDDDVSDVVKKRKADFYDKYDYLKPECEKTRWEKFKDGCKAVGEWCKEHWKIVVTVVVVIVAAALILTGVGGILAAIAAGALIGAGTGGVLGGIISKITGGSFWEGFENGAFMGAIAGIISGGMGFAFTGGIQGIALSFGQTLAIGGTTGSVSTLLSDLGDIIIRGRDISLGQVLLNMGIAGTLGAVFAGIGYGFSKIFTSLKVKIFNRENPTINHGTESFDYYKDLVDNLDVNTEPNTATFYSGTGNRELAEEFARINGKTTLEMTPGGKFLDDLHLFDEGSPLTRDEAAEIWRRLSRRYAESASGNAFGFVKDSRPGSIFNTIEYPTLIDNPNITNIFTQLLQ